MSTTQELLSTLEGFSSEKETEEFLSWSGQKKSEISKVFDKCPELFTEVNISNVKNQRKVAVDEARRRLDYLLEALVDLNFENRASKLIDNLRNAQVALRTEIDGQQIGYGELPKMIIKEADGKKRSRLFTERVRLCASLNPTREQILQIYEDGRKSLGYSSSYSLYSDLRGIDFLKVKELFDEFIRETESIYLEHLGNEVRKKAGIDLAEAERHDIGFALRGPEYDKHFPKDKLISKMNRTLQLMGINLEGMVNVVFDEKDRPGKNPGARFFPIKVPGDCRLSIKPMGGVRDYESSLHEMGHLCHYAHMDRNLFPEYRIFGDKPVTESHAFLFGSLMTERGWLKDVMRMKKPDEFVKSQLLSKLHTTRYLAALHDFEIQLRQGESNLPEKFSQTVDRALLHKTPQELYLEDVVGREPFYMAAYLRALAFSEMLKDHIVREFGKRWYENEKTGDFFKYALWPLGKKYRVGELNGMIGYTELTIEPLLESFKSAFG